MSESLIIQRNTLTTLADIVRQVAGLTKALTIDEMIEAIGNLSQEELSMIFIDYDGNTLVPSQIPNMYANDTRLSAIQVLGISLWEKSPLTWEAVVASCQDGTYKYKYDIGDKIPLDMGSEGLINMEIVGIDADTLADGSGQAHLSFIADKLLVTTHYMNEQNAVNNGSIFSPDYELGTGAVGGWEHCAMRTYMQTLKTLLPSILQKNIVYVSKTQNAIDNTNTNVDQVTTDDLWIPSYDELTGLYTAAFPSSTSASRDMVNGSSTTFYYLRNVNTGSTKSFGRIAHSTGVISYTGNANAAGPVCLGFCL